MGSADLHMKLLKKKANALAKASRSLPPKKKCKQTKVEYHPFANIKRIQINLKITEENINAIRKRQPVEQE